MRKLILIFLTISLLLFVFGCTSNLSLQPSVSCGSNWEDCFVEKLTYCEPASGITPAKIKGAYFIDLPAGTLVEISNNSYGQVAYGQNCRVQVDKAILRIPGRGVLDPVKEELITASNNQKITCYFQTCDHSQKEKCSFTPRFSGCEITEYR